MKISVIVPVYNVEEYILECLQSLVSQTYQNFEVIVVDDCGTDNSMSLVRQFIESYDGTISFQVLTHSQNQGLSAARNTGVRGASGDYLFFLDSDDYLFPSCLELLMKPIRKDSTIELAIGNYRYDSETVFPPLLLKDGSYEDEQIQLFTTHKYYMMAWNKLVSKSFLINNNLFFEEGVTHEDILWSLMVSCSLSKMAVVNYPTYYYRIRSNSIQGIKDFDNHYFNYTKIFLRSLDFVLSNKDLRSNKHLFEYILHEFKHLYLDPLFNHKPDLARCFYYDFKKSNYWSIFEIVKISKSSKLLLLHFHRFLPRYIDYFFFHRLFIVFFDK